MMGEEAHEFLQREMNTLPRSPNMRGVDSGGGASNVGALTPMAPAAGARTPSSPASSRPRTRRRATLDETPPPPPFM